MIENSKKSRKQAMKKLLSTSAIYLSAARPQWTSDTRVNYMSQNDFISYDVQEDQLNLIQRIDDQSITNLSCVRFISLIGQYPVRILYTYFDSPTQTYKLIIIPSYSFSEEFDIKTICLEKNSLGEDGEGKIKQIGQITVMPDTQSILVPVDLGNGLSHVLMIKLSNESRCLLMMYDDEMKSENYKIVKIMQTKISNLMIVLTTGKLYLMKLVTSLSCLQQICSINVDARNVQLEDAFALFLSQTYIFFKSADTIFIHVIEEEKIFPLPSITHSGIGGIVGAGNKFVYWLKQHPTLYQYKIDEKAISLEHLNTLQLEKDRISKVLNVTLSQTARNALILVNMQIGQQPPEFPVDPTVQFILFKLELYTELKISQNSIYMQNLRYICRNKKVNKLCVPKINQKVYALTGSQVHTLELHRMMGVMSFDVHPYGFYLLISYMFNIKIYSLQPTSMTLLYSFSMHNVKKVQFSPDGSTIVLFSPRKIKLIDAYSFDLKEQYLEKNYNIIDICFGAKKKNYYILLENGTIICRSFLDQSVSKIFHIFGQGHHKFLMLKIDERFQTFYCLLDNGTVISKNLRELTANEEVYEYEDSQKITDVIIEVNSNLIIFGTKSGKIRIHLNDPFQSRINFKKYSEKFINSSQITALACSASENILYVGSSNGDITVLKYIPQNFRIKKQLSREYENFLAQENPQKSNKLIQYFSFDFDLVSMAKLHGDSEQNTLEDKLEALIDKIQVYGNQYKDEVLKNFIEAEQKFNKDKKSNENIAIYREKQTKINKLRADIKLTHEKHIKNKSKLIEDWEIRMKQIYAEQSDLTDKKQYLQRQLRNQKKTLQEKINYDASVLITQFQAQEQDIEMVLKKQEFESQMQGDFDQFLISETDALKFYCQNLKQEFKKIKDKERELNKNNGYLQTAVKNMLSRKAQEEALLHRIYQELSMLDGVKSEQNSRITYLAKNLKSTEQTIHKIQNKVKNTPNNVISSDKADSDLCSYKIWMKDKVGQEVEQLQEYLGKINQIFDKKSQEMVLTSAEKNRNIEKIQVLCQKKAQIKHRLKEIKQKLVTSHFQEGVFLKGITSNAINETCKKLSECDFQHKKVNKIASFQRILDKAVDFESKNIKNYKRKIRNLGSNKGELLGEYENLKYYHKSLVDKKNKCIQNINFVKNEIEVERKKQNLGIASERTSLHRSQEETPFQKYIRHKKMKSNKNVSSLLQTAVSTPRNLFTPRYARGSVGRKI